MLVKSVWLPALLLCHTICGMRSSTNSREDWYVLLLLLVVVLVVFVVEAGCNIIGGCTHVWGIFRMLCEMRRGRRDVGMEEGSE
jgi:hypothetical protein